MPTRTARLSGDATGNPARNFAAPRESAALPRDLFLLTQPAMPRARVSIRLLCRGMLVAALGTAALIARADETNAVENDSAAKRTHSLMTAAFPFRPAPAKPAAETSPVFVATPADTDVVEMQELTVVGAQTERHMVSAIDRDLARAHAEEFNWRSGGRLARFDYGRMRIEAGLWWGLAPSNQGGSTSAKNLPLAARVDLLRIQW